jgi:hypothetical protein
MNIKIALSDDIINSYNSFKLNELASELENELKINLEQERVTNQGSKDAGLTVAIIALSISAVDLALKIIEMWKNRNKITLTYSIDGVIIKQNLTEKELNKRIAEIKEQQSSQIEIKIIQIENL